jgi:virulence factor
MKISIIGLGGISQKYYLPVLSSNENLELQIFARTADTIQKTQSIWRIQKSAVSIEDVIVWSPDAAFVLSPSSTHYEIVKKLMKSGIDIFVEKPATLHTEQTQELAELSHDLGRICMVGFNRRFAPLHQRGKEYWGSRKTEFAEFVKFRKSPFHESARDHIYDDTIHLVDAMRFFCGEVTLAHKELRMDRQLITCTGIFNLVDGGIATVINTMRSGEWRENYILSGDGLTMEIQAFSALSTYQGDEHRSWNENYAGGTDPLISRGFFGEINHFLQCVSTRQNPQTDLSDSILTQKLVENLSD